jgi:hypothetical protein
MENAEENCETISKIWKKLVNKFWKIQKKTKLNGDKNRENMEERYVE